MSTSIIIILGVVIILILLSPFISKRSEEKNFIDRGNDQQEKEHIFSQLVDLEYDFQMGKMSEEDFNKTNDELTAKAARFFQPENKFEQTQLIVDKEIKTHLEKNGLELNGEANYEK